MFKRLHHWIMNPSDMVGRVIANVSWLAMGNVVTALLGIVINLWMANHFGPEQYGIYAFVISVVMIVVPIADMGINSILIRELASKDHSESLSMGSGFLIRVVFGLITFALTGLMMLLFYSDDPMLQKYVMIGMIVLAPRLLNIAEASLNAKIEARYVVIARLIATVSITLARIAALLMDRSLVLFIWLSVIQAAIEGGFLLYFYLKRQGRILAWQVSWAQCVYLLKASWPLAVSGISASILVRFDQVMLQKYMGDAAVGHYSVALLFTEGPSFIPMIICLSVFPALVQLRKINPQLYVIRNQQFHDVVIWVGLGLAVAVTVFVPWFIRYFMGDFYGPSLAVLRILPWCLFMVAAAVVQSHYMMAENQQWVGSVARVVGCSLNVLLNLLWIPPYGLVGAAWASLLSLVVIVLVVPGLFPQTRVCIGHFFKAISAPIRLIVS